MTPTILEAHGKFIPDPISLTKEDLPYHGTSTNNRWTTPIPASPTYLAAGSRATTFYNKLDYVLSDRASNDPVGSAGNPGGGAWGAIRRWSMPVFVCPDSDPKKTVILSENWGGNSGSIANVPWPSGIKCDPAGDGHLCIINADTLCQYDFYDVVHSADGTPTLDGSSNGQAAFGNASNLAQDAGYFRSSTVGQKATGARASGTTIQAGLIFPHELVAGEINHALACSYPFQSQYIFRIEDGGAGKNSGGAITDNTDFTLGAKLQLDPALSVDTLASTFGWKNYEIIMARAIQDYGIIMVDGGGYTPQRMGFYFENPMQYGSNPYASVHSDLSGDDVQCTFMADIRTDLLLLDDSARVDKNSIGDSTEKNLCNGWT
jgi:hypothetical protein